MRERKGYFTRRLKACLGIGIVTVIGAFLTGCQTESVGKRVNQQASVEEGKIQANRQGESTQDENALHPNQTQEKTQKEPVKEQTALSQTDPNKDFWVTQEDLEREYAALHRGEIVVNEEATAIKEEYLKNPESFLIGDHELIGVEHVYNFNDELLDIARNEIFAKHGYLFDNEKYTRIFQNKNWYQAVGKEVDLSPLEKQNIEMIKWYQKFLKEKGDKERITANEVGFTPGYRFQVGEEIKLDINGDGQEEAIRVTDNLESGGLCLHISDKEQELGDGNFSSEVWIVDSDPTDRYKEIILFDEGLSSDYVDFYFYYEGGQIKSMGTAQGHMNDRSSYFNNYIKDGRLYSVFRSDLLDTHCYRRVYKLDTHHQWVMEPTGDYPTYIPLTLTRDIVVYKEKNLSSSKTQLSDGTPVIAISTDAKNWVELQYANGEKGWSYIDGEGYPKPFGPFYQWD